MLPISMRSTVSSTSTPEHRKLTKHTRRIDQAIAAYPNNASLHYLKAQAYGSQHNSQSAEAELNKALEIDPNYLPAYSSLGSLIVNTSQEDRAIAEYPKDHRFTSGESHAYTLIGMLEDRERTTTLRLRITAKRWRKIRIQSSRRITSPGFMRRPEKAISTKQYGWPRGECRRIQTWPALSTRWVGLLQEESSYRGGRATAKGRVAERGRCS
jgi:tetratricopeptide (TPR) repeat protein